jgi:carboxypeptidase C (cathepsin A)
MYITALFLTGESHAGHYISTMAAYIMQQNKIVASAGDPNAVYITLEGMQVRGSVHLHMYICVYNVS